MLQPNQITVFNKFNLLLRIRYIWCVLVPLLDYKDVVLVFVGVGGDLLLLASLSVRIEVEVGVKVRSSSSMILQGYLSSVRNLEFNIVLFFFSKQNV